tara:strand:+ start:1276 stop:1518 length:243 start_codon:yes stop_codon:yes gene_type:complete
MAKISTYTTVQSTTSDKVIGTDAASSDATKNFELGALTVAGTAPAAAGSTGTTGQIAADDDYLYVCVAADKWKRVAIATW